MPDLAVARIRRASVVLPTCRAPAMKTILSARSCRTRGSRYRARSMGGLCPKAENGATYFAHRPILPGASGAGPAALFAFFRASGEVGGRDRQAFDHAGAERVGLD